LLSQAGAPVVAAVHPLEREVEVHVEGVLLHGHVQQVLQVHTHLDIGRVRGRLLGVELATLTNISHRHGE
jgi:hypothetical protein